MGKFDPNYVPELRRGLSQLYEDTESLFAQYKKTWVAGSLAETEHQTCAPMACAIGTILLDYTSEHVSVLAKIVTEPIEPLASWTCVRSMMEPAAIVAWICDPSIDAKTRLERVFGYRFEGLTQQRKWENSARSDAQVLKKLDDRLDQVEKDAIAAGYKPVRNSKGERIRIGQKMPSATDLIECALGDGTAYRLLSSVAHGHCWTIQQLGFRPVLGQTTVIGSPTTNAYEKVVDVDYLACAGRIAISSFSRALWNFGSYVGWDKAEMAKVLDKACDTLRMDNSKRVWRPRR